MKLRRRVRLAKRNMAGHVMWEGGGSEHKVKGILSFLAWHQVPFVPVECELSGEGERFSFEFVEQMHLAMVSNLSGRPWLLLREHFLDDTFSNSK